MLTFGHFDFGQTLTPFDQTLTLNFNEMLTDPGNFATRYGILATSAIARILFWYLGTTRIQPGSSNGTQTESRRPYFFCTARQSILLPSIMNCPTMSARLLINYN